MRENSASRKENEEPHAKARSREEERARKKYEKSSPFSAFIIKL
jgi:hypothetical protein